MHKTTTEEKSQFLSIDYRILGVSEIHYKGQKYSFTDALKNTYCYLNGWKEAFPSYNKIADVFGITRDAAKERVRKLEDMGLVERTVRPGQSNFYTVNEIDFDNVHGRSYSENKGTLHEIKEAESITSATSTKLTQAEKAISRSFVDELDYPFEVSELEQEKPKYKFSGVHPWGNSYLTESNGDFREEVILWSMDGTTSEEGAISKLRDYLKSIEHPRTYEVIKFERDIETDCPF